MAGLRVVRGTDWKWKDQDGGEGHVGTVVEKGRKNKWMTVLWDNGTKNSYRSGAEDCNDLLVVDNGPAGTRHRGVTCDVCSENNIRGIRWKCTDCYDYDLCTECYGNDKHDIGHTFKRFDVRSATGEEVGKRRLAAKFQTRGIYKGAKVVRGKDWQWGSQDGGEGKVGKIDQVGYKIEGGEEIHCVVVEWPHSDTGHIYCFGWNGRVDVKCTASAIGWGYYKSHLPSLGPGDDLIEKSSEPMESSEGEGLGEALAKLVLVGLLAGATRADSSERKEETLRKFKPGDEVRLEKDPSTLQRLQQGHGGFSILMLACLGEMGVVKNIDDDGDLNVTFGGTDWCLNPAAVTVVAKPIASNRRTASRFEVGDQVKVTVTQDKLKTLQVGHGGWDPLMQKVVDKVGVITSIDSDDDLRVQFAEGTCLLNPNACVSLDSAVTKDTAPGAKQMSGENAISFSVGDKVTIGLPFDLIVMLQEGHGGWSAEMANLGGQVGVVKEVRSDGDLRVAYGVKCWTFNPAIFIMQNEDDQNDKDTNADNSRASDDSTYQCTICHDNNISVVFDCGHFVCETCADNLKKCHVCRKMIAMRTKMFV